MRPEKLSPAQLKSQRFRAACVLGLVICGLAGIKFTWWSMDRGGTDSDSGIFLEYSLRLQDAFYQRGLWGLYAQYLHTLSWKGPLVSLQALPFYFLFGRSVASAQLTNAFYLVVFCIYLYRLCRFFWPRDVSILAVFTTGMCPGLYGLCNVYLREYGIAMLIAMTVYHLIRSQGLQYRTHTVVLGVLLGLGVLYRILYPLYVAPLYLACFGPHLVQWYRQRDKTGVWRRFLRGCLLIAGIATLLAFHWYWRNWRSIVDFSWRVAYGDLSVHYGAKNPLDWMAVKGYFATCARDGVSYWLLIAMPVSLIGCGIAAYRGRLNLKSLFPGESALILLAWLSPYIVFLLGSNKHFRFMIPLLPAFGILLAVILRGSFQAFRRAWLLFGLLPVVALLICVVSLFAVQPPGGPVVAAFFERMKPEGFVSPPDRRIWPNAELLHYIDELQPRRHGKPLKLLLVKESPYFQVPILRVTSLLEQLPMEIQPARFTYDEEVLRNRLDTFDYFLATSQPDPTPYGSNLLGFNMLQQGVQEGRFVSLDHPIILPDNSQVFLWRRIKSENES